MASPNGESKQTDEQRRAIEAFRRENQGTTPQPIGTSRISVPIAADESKAHHNAMSDPITRGELDAKFAAAEARTDTKFEKLLSEITALKNSVDNLRSESKTTRSTVIAVGVASFFGIAALVASLWQAGISIQGNMIMSFQAGEAVQKTASPAGQTPTK